MIILRILVFIGGWALYTLISDPASEFDKIEAVVFALVISALFHRPIAARLSVYFFRSPFWVYAIRSPAYKAAMKQVKITNGVEVVQEALAHPEVTQFDNWVDRCIAIIAIRKRLMGTETEMEVAKRWTDLLPALEEVNENTRTDH